MKIIGENPQTLILEASKDEVANLIGFINEYDAKLPRGMLRAGAVINVSSMFHRLYHLERRKGELERLAKQLRAQADLLESTEPVVQGATEEST